MTTMLRMVAVATLITSAPAVGTAAEAPAHISCPPPWTEPWVPDESAAKQIYLAVAKTRFPSKFRKYPVVTVSDGGDHWDVSQESGKPPPKARPDEIVVSAGGGQLYMSIDKCTGAISNAAFNR